MRVDPFIAFIPVMLAGILIIAGVVLIIAGAAFVIARLRRRAYLRRQKALMARFAALYHLDARLLEPCRVDVRPGMLVRPGKMTLHVPYWEQANKDGARDRRHAGNRLVSAPSFVDIDDWRISSEKTPDVRGAEDVYAVVWALRADGHEVAQHRLEIDKAMRGRDAWEDSHIRLSAQAVHDRFVDEPHRFERLVAEAFRAHGWHAKTTARTNDGGFDVRIGRAGQTGIVECKCYDPERSSVGRPAIQKLVGANESERADLMYFVTTGRFSKNAREYAEKAGVVLMDGGALVVFLDEADMSAGPRDRMPSMIELGRLDHGDFVAQLPPDVRTGMSDGAADPHRCLF